MRNQRIVKLARRRQLFRHNGLRPRVLFIAYRPSCSSSVRTRRTRNDNQQQRPLRQPAARCIRCSCGYFRSSHEAASFRSGRRAFPSAGQQHAVSRQRCNTLTVLLPPSRLRSPWRWQRHSSRRSERTVSCCCCCCRCGSGDRVAVSCLPANDEA